MNVLFNEYLSSTNPIASGIVTFLQILFYLWIAGLIAYTLRLFLIWWQIKKNENVQSLVNVQPNQDSEDEGSDRKTLAEQTFREYCKKQSIRENSSVSKHLKAIFLAGWDESRLEASELINHTTSNLFRWNGLFRSVLAVFIVIGLLGTLFGLTDSLTQLSPALEASAANETSVDGSQKMTQALSVLLNDMKGAFAPSIWGIVFTVLGIILYAVYLQIACHPVKSILERLTLTVWIPQLYPTTSQKLIQTLQESEAQMRSGYETAARVGELVDNIQGNISDFDQNLSRASAITQPLNEAVTQVNKTANTLNQFSQKFEQNVTRITGFQDEIRKLHQQFRNVANQKLDEQNQNLVKTLNALKNYEKGYIASHQQIDDALKNFINEATKANKMLNNQLKSFDAPITKAADQMRGTFQNLTEYMNRIIASLQVEIRTQNKNYEAQLNAVTNLSEGIFALLDKLDKKIEKEGIRVSELDSGTKIKRMHFLKKILNSLLGKKGN